MFGRETFIVRVAEDAMAPRVRMGDYVWIDPDEPATPGRFVAVRDPGRGGETVVRLLVERDGRRFLRALDERCPERIVDASNETDIRGVVVFVGNTVGAPPPAPVRIGEGACLASTPSPPRPPCGKPVRPRSAPSGGEVFRPRLHVNPPTNPIVQTRRRSRSITVFIRSREPT